MNLKFSDLKWKIIEELKKRDLWIHEPITLVDGFINQPIYDELTWSFVIWWPTIPMVMLIGNNSWRLYFFAAKALLPNDIK